MILQHMLFLSNPVKQVCVYIYIYIFTIYKEKSKYIMLYSHGNLPKVTQPTWGHT